MAQDFKVRRDNSTNNVPTVGYNEGVDAQDIILFGACKVTETLVADGTGSIKLTYNPVSIDGTTFIDSSDVRRGRNLNNDITIISVGGAATYYAGSVSPVDKTLKVYTDEARTSVVSGASVQVTYYKRIPLEVDTDGKLAVAVTGKVNTNIVGSSATIPVSIKSSDVAFSQQTKGTVMLKKEGAIAAGASANALSVAIGDGTKEMFITNAICYYNGTDTDTDKNVSFWFDITDSSGASLIGTMDMFMSPRVKGMTQIDFGPTGIKVPAGGSFRFRVGSSWTANTIHVLALGYQYT